MNFLLRDNYELKFNKAQGFIEIYIKIINENFCYKGVLPNKLYVKKFYKYNFDEHLQKHIEESKVLNVNFDFINGILHLYLTDIEFENNIIYNTTTKITLEKVFNYDEFDKFDNLESSIKLIKSLIEHVKFLENKVINLEEKVINLQNEVDEKTHLF